VTFQLFVAQKKDNLLPEGYTFQSSTGSRLVFDFKPESKLSISDSPRWRFSTTKIEQKIVTGGSSKTSTPILKFLIKRAFELERTALHIEHCAATGD